jgi:hypothetical protein
MAQELVAAHDKPARAAGRIRDRGVRGPIPTQQDRCGRGGPPALRGRRPERGPLVAEAPSPFRRLFKDGDNTPESRRFSVYANGETRTRTGDTTIFSRVVPAFKFVRFAGDCCRFDRCRRIRAFADFASVSGALRPTAGLVGRFRRLSGCRDTGSAGPSRRCSRACRRRRAGECLGRRLASGAPEDRGEPPAPASACARARRVPRQDRCRDIASAAGVCDLFSSRER